MNTATVVPAVEGTSRDAPVLTDEGDDTQPHRIGLRVELVEDDDTFLRMGPVWNRLVDEARVDHPFLRYEWVSTWWECFKPAGKLHILVVVEGADCHRPADVRPGTRLRLRRPPLARNRQCVYGTVRSHFDPKGKRCL